MTGTYAINNVQLCPTSGKWVRREALGIDGTGHPVYPAVREFELSWDFMTPFDFSALHTLYQSVSTTGTCVARLPEFGASSYTYKDYSGCTLREPEVGEFFEGHYSNVLLVIGNIK